MGAEWRLRILWCAWCATPLARGEARRVMHTRTDRTGPPGPKDAERSEAQSPHPEREHALGVDPHVHRPAVQELLPVGAVTRDVHLEQRLAKAAFDLDRDRATVH